MAYSARLAGYLAPAADGVLPHVSWLHSRGEPGPIAFQGLATLALAALGVAFGPRRRGFVVVATAVAFALSFGPVISVGGLRLPSLFEALRLTPFGRMMRAPERFAVVVTLGVGVLAALGLARVLRWTGRRQLGVGASILTLVCLELLPARLNTSPAPKPSPATSWLAAAPRGPVLELPWDGAHLGSAGDYMYWSTSHWQPLAFGLGAFGSAEHLSLGMMGKRFPDEDVVAVYRALGIRYIVVHLDALPFDRAHRFASAPLPPGLSRVVDPELETTRVYVVEPEGPRIVPRYLSRLAEASH